MTNLEQTSGKGEPELASLIGEKEGKTINKWIAIPVIAVLTTGIIGVGYFLWQQANKL